MINKLLVSVVIPAYNTEVNIERCLISLINQSYTNIEIIVVDDGSKDGTAKVVKQISTKDSRIKYLYQPNKGVSCARNKGINASKGEYIIFVDADDYIEQGGIEILVNGIEEKKVDVVYFEYYYEKNNKKTKSNSRLDYKFYTGGEKIALIEQMCKGQFFASVWRGIYRATLVKRIKFRELDFAEDMLFNIEYLLMCNSAFLCNNSVYHYIYNSESALNYLQNDLSHTINVIDVLNDVYKKANDKRLNNAYQEAVHATCKKIVDMNWRYSGFKLWAMKINPVNIDELLIKKLRNGEYFKIYVKYWYGKVIRKIKKIFLIKQ